MTTDRQQTPAAVARGRGASSRKRKLLDERLRLLLAGAGNAAVELPAISELLAAVISLASGRRRKALLPLGSVPTEFALVRNKISWGPYPLCTGYQGTGVIEAVGAEVEGLAADFR